ncbi:MAG: DUF5716 family protein, partial [Treponema sp.]|nr:DUF5716 family protein [Treponema sp.]
MPAGVFSILPRNFFSPLSSVNREHYAALLVLYYRLFQENTRGLERELVVREFMNYIALHRDTVEEESDTSPDDEISGSGGSPDNSPELFQPGPKEQELNFDDASDESGAGNNTEKTAEASSGKSREATAVDERILASRFLKRLISSGWLGEETLADFTRVINITAWGKPFMKGLADVDGGLKTEYESHVVTVYSLLCGETIKKDGHHAVLRAHEEARSLIDSLKVLSQSIKGYYDKLNAETIRSKAASVLHEHYDLYAGEVLDRAYKRLKTSDNVSRYRQSIFKQVSELLHDEEWLNESAGKYMRILSGGSSTTSRAECREKLEYMLEEIRDDLKSVDPLEDEIDRRNAAYSRSSTEIIKAYIEPDSTVAGKIGTLIKAIYRNKGGVPLHVAHGLYRIGFLSPTSLSLRRPRDEGDFASAPSKADLEALGQSEEEFLERMRRRLSIKRIGAWLDEQGGADRVLIPKELITGEDSYVRFVYALLYGDSRNNFGYDI